MSKPNRGCNENEYYDSSMEFARDPSAPGARMLRQCQDTFKFNTVPAIDCPKNSYLNYGCLDNIGKDLLYNENLVPPVPETHEQRAIRASIANQWRQISLEGCTVQRVMGWTPSTPIDRDAPVSTVPMNANGVAEMGLPSDIGQM